MHSTELAGLSAVTLRPESIRRRFENTKISPCMQAVEQLAFADVVLLNKVDLVDDAEKAEVIKRIKVRFVW